MRKIDLQGRGVPADLPRTQMTPQRMFQPPKPRPTYPLISQGKDFQSPSKPLLQGTPSEYDFLSKSRYPQNMQNMQNMQNILPDPLNMSQYSAYPRPQSIDIGMKGCTNYECLVPVQMKSSGREDWRTIVTIQIQISSTGPHNEQTLSIELTDEKDAFFLYTLTCGETEFHQLKAEQSLVVDFQAFPGKFIELLELSMKKEEETPRFICILEEEIGSGAILHIVETNLFKQLTHLNLRFKSGTDETLKRYLAGKLLQFKTENENLNIKLEQTEDTLSTQLLNNDKLKAENQGVREENRRIMDELKLESQRQLNDLKERMLETQNINQERWEEERNKLLGKLERETTQLKGEVAHGNSQMGMVKGERAHLESENNLLGNKLSSVEHELGVVKLQLEEIRGVNKELEAGKYKQENIITEYKVKLENLDRGVKDKGEQVVNIQKLLDSNKSRSEHIEDTVNMLKATNTKMEEKLHMSVQEVTKGNNIIQRMQGDHKAQKAKLKAKHQSVLQHEESVAKLKIELVEFKRELLDYKRETDIKVNEIKVMEGNNLDLKSKLDESQKVIESNNQVIQWLNKSLSEAQKANTHMMSTVKGSTTSSYFKPSYSTLDQLGTTTTKPPQPSTRYNSSQYSAGGAYTSKYSGYGSARKAPPIMQEEPPMPIPFPSIQEDMGTRKYGGISSSMGGEAEEDALFPIKYIQPSVTE